MSRTGVTKEMKYLKKTQRTSESWFREQLFFRGDDKTETRLVGTKINLADLFTKALSKEEHWRIVKELGMMSKAEFFKFLSRAKKAKQQKTGPYLWGEE